jgi:uncharacterized protein YozE (UPF0346 family)
MEFNSVEEINTALGGVMCKEDGVCKVADGDALRGEIIERLAFNAAVNENEEVREHARIVIKSAASALGIYSASIQGLYEAMGSGDVTGLTVPAINIRGLTFDVARAVFRAGAKNKSNAFIFEIAKSEIAYTAQHPVEYTTIILAAAIKEGYKGPVFIQGDHFQINAKSYEADKAGEVAALKTLIKEAIEGEFYNIDIDASTLVDLSRSTVMDQQRPNFEITAFMTSYIRGLEPDGVTVSIGGEIGEVGSQNSTVEELRAFMDGYLDLVAERHKGISKISVQTGTSHGGVVLADGTIAKVSVDFDTIEELSKASREEYGLSGVVQHGASTLPDDDFHLFRKREASEVHLATGFQNMIYDSKSFPKELRDEIYSYLKENMKAEWGEGVTEEQFIYKTRKQGFGPFKEKMWSLPAQTRAAIGAELEDRFDYLFKQLNSVDTLDAVKKYVG